MPRGLLLLLFLAAAAAGMYLLYPRDSQVTEPPRVPPIDQGLTLLPPPAEPPPAPAAAAKLQIEPANLNLTAQSLKGVTQVLLYNAGGSPASVLDAVGQQDVAVASAAPAQEAGPTPLITASLPDACRRLAPGDSCRITLTYSLPAPGNYGGGLTLVTDLKEEPLHRIAVSLSAAVPTAPRRPGPSARELARQARARDAQPLVLGAGRTPAPEAGYPDHPNRRLVQPTARRYVITTDHYIEAVLETSINSEIPARVTAVISSHVYANGAPREILIPAGSKLVGSYEPLTSRHQRRLAIRWNRIIRAVDGAHIVIDEPAADQMGRGGLSGYRDDRLTERLGTVLLTTAATTGLAAVGALLSSGTKITTQGATTLIAPDPLSEAISAGTASLSAAASEIIRDQLAEARNIPPVIYIPSGTVLLLTPTSDLVLQPPSAGGNGALRPSPQPSRGESPPLTPQSQRPEYQSYGSPLQPQLPVSSRLPAQQ